MEGREVMTLFWFCLAWIAWCAVHSLMIAPPVTKYIKNCLGERAGYYRLIYNSFSMATLFPLLIFTWIDRGEVVFSWSGWTVVIRFFLFMGAIFCFLGGAKGYDLQMFLGIKQLRGAKESVLLGDGHRFSEAGIFGLIRHPWYVGSFLFVWSIFATYHQKNVAVASILSCYLLVGTYLEERKILAEYGESYRRYRERVSMFIPIKWLLRRCF